MYAGILIVNRCSKYFLVVVDVGESYYLLARVTVTDGFGAGFN